MCDVCITLMFILYMCACVHVSVRVYVYHKYTCASLCGSTNFYNLFVLLAYMLFDSCCMRVLFMCVCIMCKTHHNFFSFISVRSCVLTKNEMLKVTYLRHQQ